MRNAGRLSTFDAEACPGPICELLADGIGALLQRYSGEGAEPVEKTSMLAGFDDAAAIQTGAQAGPERAH